MMSEIELLVDFHLDGDRQGPGSASATLQALNLIRIPKDKNVKIADIGCGSGAQTFILAQNLSGTIIAVDLFPQLLDKLNRKSKELGFQDKITTITGSMDALPFVNEEFDLIWSEGAIYIMGFEAGIKQWRDYLKPGGFLAVSEMTWTTKSRPEELKKHWEKEYPEIDTASAKIRILEENGYSPVGYFILPEECWLDNYYVPMERRFEAFLRKHNSSDMASSIVNAETKEISLYRKYKEYINYGFYIAKKL